MSRLELIKRCLLFFEICGTEPVEIPHAKLSELLLTLVSLCLDVCDDLLQPIDSERLLERFHTLDIIGVTLASAENFILRLISLNPKLVLLEVMNTDEQQQSMWHI